MESTRKRDLELLAPARDSETAIEAINHGADAVYIGPPGFGARKAASNSIADIKRVTDYAHIFGARVYVTLNTILFDSELKEAEKMIRQLYEVNIDALIIQDMGILRLDIPPVELHASTQCDIRTPEKAKFLEEAGFSQIVLARELSLPEIKAICESVTIPVETFVHGALCTSYSGRCAAGFICGGRSGNRGECPQICRWKFDLLDKERKIITKDKYLLSLKDFNAYTAIEQLVDAGVSSFKIEGRLKDTGYVKNVVALYNRRINEIVEKSAGRIKRSSYGISQISFEPAAEKSFNREFTTYNLLGDLRSRKISSMDTPKSKGEIIRDLNQLNPGDGVSFFNRKGEYDGIVINGIKDGKIIANRPVDLPRNAKIFRTSDIRWKKLMASKTAERKLPVDINIDSSGISAKDISGSFVRINMDMKAEKAEKETDYEKIFSKLGNTPFILRSFDNGIFDGFLPASFLTRKRRELIAELLRTKRATYKFKYRRKENKSYSYPLLRLDYRDNVSNRNATEFYREHGVTEIEGAIETGENNNKERIMMTTRHCILRELGLCMKEKKESRVRSPFYLRSGKNEFKLEFDCSCCEMHVIKPL